MMRIVMVVLLILGLGALAAGRRLRDAALRRQASSSTPVNLNTATIEQL